MSYRVQLGAKALSKMGGLPPDALGVIARALAPVLKDPYDVFYSQPTGLDARERMAVVEESGWVELEVDDDARLVTVTELVWID